MRARRRPRCAPRAGKYSCPRPKAPSGRLFALVGLAGVIARARARRTALLALCRRPRDDGDPGVPPADPHPVPAHDPRPPAMTPRDPSSSDASAPPAGGAADGVAATGQVVFWHRDAPPQPAFGAPCNGCGLCCLAEPCPLGMVVSRRRSGPCAALRWIPADIPGSPGRYVCGMVADPAAVTGWRRAWALRWMARLARRWIAAGQGCDALPLQVSSAPAHRPERDH